MRNKYFLVSLDKDLGGRHFFLRYRGENRGSYGKNIVTVQLSLAKTYCKLGNAMNMAEKISEELGEGKKIYVHSWHPTNILGWTTIVAEYE